MSRDDILRNRLIACLQRLSSEKLIAMERFLAQLEGSGERLKECDEIEQSAVEIQSGGKTPHSKDSAEIQSGGKTPHSKDWPHAPVHRISEQGTFIVTAGTLQKQHYFHDSERLDLLESSLLSLAKQFKWDLEAWAVFSNHYHFVGHSLPESGALNRFLGNLHYLTAMAINQMDRTPGRQVWHNFWETALTYEKSYLARLNYVHQNAVRHGLVRVANQYPWCSAVWFERSATAAQVKTIYSFKTDKLNVLDDFDVI